MTDCGTLSHLTLVSEDGTSIYDRSGVGPSMIAVRRSHVRFLSTNRAGCGVAG